MSIFDASEKYIAEGVPLVSWRARNMARARRATGRQKARCLLGIRAVIAESYERIHRSNLVGMGILPLQFLAEEDTDTLGLQGDEVFEIMGLPELLEAKFASGRQIRFRATGADGNVNEFQRAGAASTRRRKFSITSTAEFCSTCLRQLLASKPQPEEAKVG